MSTTSPTPGDSRNQAVRPRRPEERREGGFDRIVDAIAQCVISIDATARPLFANRAGRDALGLALREELDGLPAEQLWDDHSLAELTSTALPQAASGQEWEGSLTLQRASGDRFTTSAVVIAHGEDEADDQQFTLLFADHETATGLDLDPLTGLATLPAFLDRLDQDLSSASSDTPVSVLVIGIDRLRRLSYTLGQEAVNGLMLDAAERIRDTIRDEDALARIESDTFAVICAGASVDVTDRIAARVLDALEEPHTASGRDIAVHASLGMCETADGDTTPENLVRDADAARSEALRLGGSRAERFVDGLRTRAAERFETEAELLEAIAGNQFVLHYQPEVNLRTGDIVGFEALIRWEHPEHGMVPPDRFIPIAEDNGMILRIGRWVLEEACRQAMTWSEAFPENRPFIAVNVSPRQLAVPSIVEQCREVLEQTGVDPGQIQIEITESVLVEQPDIVLERLTSLRDLGFSLAIDDFGSGYSSLGYLKAFPVDVLKIDRALIVNIATDAKDWAIVNGVLGMSHAMGLRVVAEGIEDGDQAGALRILGCDIAQGWHFERARSPQEQTKLLSKSPPWQLKSDSE